ncbi:MAG: hypothetical protein ABIR30_03985 [Chitinophagaceae bacterium]
MKKPVILALSLIFLSISSWSQEDFGYKTHDIGAETQINADGMAFILHLAMNTRIHHSLILQGGYNHVSTRKVSPTGQEKGSGWGGAIGYRYYTGVIPKRFYIGVRATFWKMDIDWSTSITKGTSKLNILQPAVETGYTFLINEVFFITPYYMATQSIKLKTNGAEVQYGEGLSLQPGISAGFRF